MAKITGIGGVFFKSKGEHAALAVVYAASLITTFVIAPRLELET
jgi:hypothetical protein